MNIDVLDDGKLRMQIDYDCFDYYDCWKDVFIEGGIEWIEKVVFWEKTSLFLCCLGENRYLCRLF